MFAMPSCTTQITTISGKEVGGGERMCEWK